MRRLIAICILVMAVLGGCGNQAAQSPIAASNPELSQDMSSTEPPSPGEIEATMLENYLQLALGNMEAYADGLARDREVTLVGLLPLQLLFGQNLKELDAYKLPFYGQTDCAQSSDGDGSDPDLLCYRLLPKNLKAHIYRDGSVAWVSDELSYRLPHNGKEAAIPIRLTAVLVREIDRWVVVMEHMSYGVPEDLLLAWAKENTLSAPMPFETHSSDRGRGGLLERAFRRYLNADELARAKHAQVMKGKEQRAAETDADFIQASNLLLLMPGLRQEYRGAAAYQAPSLALQFAAKAQDYNVNSGKHVETAGELAKIDIDSYRLSVAANKRVAWMLANLSVQTQVGGQPVTIRLRATCVFAFDAYGWNIVQTHISVPVTEAQLAQQVFAAGSPRRQLPAR